MGLVAVVAGHAAGVFGGRHLGKVLRLGRVPFMTTAAQVSDLGQLRRVRDGVGGVLRQRTVARFAGYVGVFAGGPGFGFLIVTKHAGVLPGEGYGMLADQVERTGAVVAILPKSLGDDGAADDKKGRQGGEQYQGRPQKMSGITEKAAHFTPFMAGI